MKEKGKCFTGKDFIKSSFCAPVRFDCVAVAHKDGVIAVRNTRSGQEEMVLFDEKEWGAFIQGVKKGEFDFGIV